LARLLLGCLQRERPKSPWQNSDEDKGKDKIRIAEKKISVYTSNTSGDVAVRDKEIARNTYEEYKLLYGGNIQGLCEKLAKTIQSKIGGTKTAGYITWYGGSCRRSHWWIEKNGIVIDPMGDDRLGDELGYTHEKIHQDDSVLYD